MTDYLVFTLAASLASFGGVAVGERRPSGNRPTKSQVTGILAAAIGIPRADEERQRALAASLGFAVRVTDAGMPASDYHTAQRATDVSIRKRAKSHGPLATRRDELDCDELKTVLSMREFRTDIMTTAVVWLRQLGPATLSDMRDRLMEPAFVLFAGRKAFPLMLPCRPVIITADTIEAALAAYDEDRKDDRRSFEQHYLAGRLPRRSSNTIIYADADARLGNETQRIETRRDQPETRAKWGFGLRDELVVPLPATEKLP